MRSLPPFMLNKSRVFFFARSASNLWMKMDCCSSASFSFFFFISVLFAIESRRMNLLRIESNLITLHKWMTTKREKFSENLIFKGLFYIARVFKWGIFSKLRMLTCDSLSWEEWNCWELMWVSLCSMIDLYYYLCSFNARSPFDIYIVTVYYTWHNIITMIY